MPEADTPQDDYTFDHYPRLSELLRGTGIPGFRYYHITNANRRRAELEGGLKAVEGVPSYTITGPKGFADVCLMCDGDRIMGADHTASCRPLYADSAIAEMTGLDPEDNSHSETTKVDQLIANAKQPDLKKVAKSSPSD